MLKFSPLLLHYPYNVQRFKGGWVWVYSLYKHARQRKYNNGNKIGRGPTSLSTAERGSVSTASSAARGLGRAESTTLAEWARGHCTDKAETEMTSSQYKMYYGHQGNRLAKSSAKYTAI